MKILLFYAGSVLEAKSFDTHGDGNAGKALRDFLNGQKGKYVTFDFLG